VGGNLLRADPSFHEVGASSAESRHQRLFPAVAERDDGDLRSLLIRVHDGEYLEGAHLAEIGGAHDYRRRVPLDHRHGVSGLRGVNDLHPQGRKRIDKPLGEEDIAVDQEHLDRLSRAHLRTSELARRPRSRTSTISSSSDSRPTT